MATTSPNPLPPQKGTSDEVIKEGIRLLSRRLDEHGGQLAEDEQNITVLRQWLAANGFVFAEVAFTAAQVRDALWECVCQSFKSLKFSKFPQALYMKLLAAAEQKRLAKDEARRLREAAENKTASFDLAAQGEAFATQKTKEQQDKIDATAKQQREQIIHDYTVSAGPNRIDHGKSEDGKAFLKKVRLTLNGKFSETATLACVEALRWCDSVEQMQRRYDQFVADFNNRAANEREARQQRERSGFVGARGR